MNTENIDYLFMTVYKRLISVFILFAITFLISATGFVIIEKWPVLDAVYMTAVTLATVGYGDLTPKTPAGKIFTIFVIILGVGTLAYTASLILSFVVEGELTGIIRRKRMEKRIQSLTQHYIICGALDVAKYIIDELVQTKHQFVVIDNSTPANTQFTDEDKIIFINDNPANENVLQRAGIDKAAGLISALSTDKDNLFVVLTARGLNPNIRIVSRSIDQETVHKLTRAGANAVVSTEVIGGLRMVSEMIRPTVTTFLDTMLRQRGSVLRVDEAQISGESDLLGKTLKQAQIAEKTGLVVIAIKDSVTENYKYTPPMDTVLREKDILIVIGDIEQISKLRKLAAGQG